MSNKGIIMEILNIYIYIYIFIHYMCDDILFSLTKSIPIMFEHIIPHYQTLYI